MGQRFTYHRVLLTGKTRADVNRRAGELVRRGYQPLGTCYGSTVATARGAVQGYEQAMVYGVQGA